MEVGNVEMRKWRCGNAEMGNVEMRNEEMVLHVYMPGRKGRVASKLPILASSPGHTQLSMFVTSKTDFGLETRLTITTFAIFSCYNHYHICNILLLCLSYLNMTNGSIGFARVKTLFHQCVSTINVSSRSSSC